MRDLYVYTVGGNVKSGTGALYVERAADERLLSLCLTGAFVYILTARQLGKSSLMVRTTVRLAEQGVRSVSIDLTQIGTQEVTVESWYFGLAVAVADRVELATEPGEWWEKQAGLSHTQRFTRFIEQVLLREFDGRLVIFVDEIDTTLKFGFTDDFFAAIRSFHNARALNPAFERLSFVLIGCATPGDLIRDDARTPFNIGERVDVTDFTPEEAAPLARGLGGEGPASAGRILGWVLKWTGGHPFLTQDLCRAIASDPVAGRSEAAVDQLVTDRFFGPKAWANLNLDFVRDMLTKRVPEGLSPTDLLDTFYQIRRGRPVEDEERSPLKVHLKLSGVVKRSGHRLVIRNEIYRRVFDDAWIESNMPPSRARAFAKTFVSTVRRQLPVAGLVVSVVAIAVTLAVAHTNIRAASVAEAKAAAAEDRVRAAEERERAAEERERDAAAAAGIAKAARNAATGEAEKAWGNVAAGARELGNALASSAQADKAIDVFESLRAGPASQYVPPLSPLLGEFEVYRHSPLWLMHFSPQGNLDLKQFVRGSAFHVPTARAVAGIRAGDGLALALIDVRTSEVLATTPTAVSHLACLAFSADGLFVAAGGDGPADKGGEAREEPRLTVWDVSGHKAREMKLDELPPSTEGSPNPILVVALDPQGRRLVYGDGVGDLLIRDLPEGKVTPLAKPGRRGQERGDQDSLGAVLSAAFSSDGGRLVCGDVAGKVCVWDLSGSEPRALPNWNEAAPPRHNGQVNAVAFFRNVHGEDRLLSAAADKTIREWDLKTASPGHVLVGDTIVGGMAVCQAAGRDLVFSGGEDGNLRVWDLEGEGTKQVVGSPGGEIVEVACSPDGRLVFRRTYKGDLGVWALARPAAADDGSHLSARPGVPEVESPSGKSDRTSPTHRQGRFPTRWPAFQTDSETGVPEVRVLRTHSSPVTCVCVAADGPTALSGDTRGQVVVWDLKLAEPLACLDSNSTPLTAKEVAKSPGPGTNSSITSRPPSTRLAPVGSEITSLAYAGSGANGCEILFARNDGAVVQWDLLAPGLINGGMTRGWTVPVLSAAVTNERRVITRFMPGPGSMAVSWLAETDPSAPMPLSGGDEFILWGLQANPSVKEFKTGETIRGVVFSQAGDHILCAHDRDLTLWRIDSPSQPVARLQGGHKAALGPMAFSPDGTRVVTSDKAGQLVMWELPSSPDTGRGGKKAGSRPATRFTTGRTASTRPLAAEGMRVPTATPAPVFLGSTRTEPTCVSFALRSGEQIIDNGICEVGTAKGVITFWNLPDERLDPVVQRRGADGTADQREIRALEGHDSRVSDILPAGSDQPVISAGADGTLRRWGFCRASNQYPKFKEKISKVQNQLASRMPAERAQAMLSLAEWYALREEWAWAIEFYEKSPNGRTNDELLSMARCYWKDGRLKEAEDYFAKVESQTTSPGERGYVRLCRKRLAQLLSSGPSSRPATGPAPAAD